VAAPPADAGGPKGATPTEFVLPDSLPSAAIPTPPAEVLGAAPVAVLPGPMGSDSELSADAVELLPSTADEVGSASARRTPTPDDTPRDGIEVRVAPSTPLPPAPIEPREVEPEAVEMLESAEHQATPAPVPTAGKVRTLTPPPVRPELASLTPPPVPPEIAAAHAPPAQHPPAVAAALFEEFQTPAMGGEPVPEALARRSLQKRSKPWFEEVFDEDYLRTLPFMTPDQTAREVSFIREALSPPKGGEVLDLACGYGRHALELTQQGLRLTGLDLSLPLLIRAADDAQRRGLAVNFVHADMREMTFNSQFDAAYCVLSSFGYFDEETNLRVASAVCRALKPGGRFLLDIINRDYIVGDVPSRVWWEGDGCVVLEEVDFNYHTSRVLIRRSVVFGNGRQSEQEISMRAYSLHEVGKLLRQAGLRVLQISGGIATKSRFFGAASRNIIAVCERPAT
jgi:SAM-dependent methyltransferase